MSCSGEVRIQNNQVLYVPCAMPLRGAPHLRTSPDLLSPLWKNKKKKGSKQKHVQKKTGNRMRKQFRETREPSLLDCLALVLRACPTTLVHFPRSYTVMVQDLVFLKGDE